MLTPSNESFILIMCLLTYAIAIPLRAGLFSIAPGAFAGVGAYTSALLVMKHGFAIWEGVAVASIGCGVLGAVIAVPLVRVRGLYTGIATLGLLVVATGVEASLSITGGSNGLLDVPFADLRVVLVVSIIVIAGSWCWFDRTHVGRRLDLLAHDPVLARVSGISIVRYRMSALVLSATIGGFAGALYAHSFYYLDPTQFDVYVVVNIVAYAIVGGTGYWAGPLLGAGVLSYMNVLLQGYPNWSTVVVGVLMTACLVLYPGGVGAALRRTFRYRGSVARARRNHAARAAAVGEVGSQ